MESRRVFFVAHLVKTKPTGRRKNHTFLTTACGSLCSTCAVKKPQVFCANCEESGAARGQVSKWWRINFHIIHVVMVFVYLHKWLSLSFSDWRKYVENSPCSKRCHMLKKDSSHVCVYFFKGCTGFSFWAPGLFLLQMLRRHASSWQSFAAQVHVGQRVRWGAQVAFGFFNSWRNYWPFLTAAVRGVKTWYLQSLSGCEVHKPIMGKHWAWGFWTKDAVFLYIS